MELAPSFTLYKVSTLVLQVHYTCLGVKVKLSSTGIHIMESQWLNQGKLIPVQVTAISRRRKGVPRGSKPAPQGRPPLLSRIHNPRV